MIKLFIKELKNWRRILTTLGLSLIGMIVFLEIFAINAHQSEGILLLIGFGLSFLGFYLARLIAFTIKSFLIGRQDVRAHMYSDGEVN